MGRTWLTSALIMMILIFTLTGICISGPEKGKGSSNSNKQSIETSTRGKERAEKRHQLKEERNLGIEGGEDKKDKKEGNNKEKRNHNSDDIDDDNNEKKATSGEEQKSPKGKWWEIFKKREP